MHRILIVDDQPENLEMLRALLVGHGYQVDSAVHGKEALEKARAQLPDLIVSDILMPVMDGFSLCRQWQTSPDLRNIPFVFYTATYTDARDERLALELGAARFLVKPIEPDVLILELRKALEAGDSELATAPKKPPVLEEVFLKEYNQFLVHRLEKKALDLERANAQLKQQAGELQEAKNLLEARVKERTSDLQSVNRELETFSYSVSHDLRVPLRVIDGYSSEVMETCGASLNGEGLAMLSKVRHACKQMGTMIAALLDLAHVSQRELHHEAVDLSALAKEVIAELSHIDPARKVQVRIADNLLAEGDKGLLLLVLQNLIENAWKYTAHEEVAQIEVGAEPSNGEAAFFVKDNGAGFNPALAGKLFGAFQRLHEAKEFGGIGIGLATVQRIVQRHGGRIWAEGTPGMGATFHFSLPLHPHSDPPDAA